LERSAAVVSVVPSFDAPHEFSEAEIRAFAGSTVKKKPDDFRKGDMVLVKEGYLRNLYGVVEAQTSPRRCKVAFSFHLRRFSESIPVTWIKKVANIFERGICASGKESGEIGTKHRHLRGEKS
jgi:transcription antitermination factor NusG